MIKYIITTLSVVLLFATSSMATTFTTGESDGNTWITVDSITWTLDGTYLVGAFVTGDPYVICPSGCDVTNISPSWDGSGNGAMLNPSPGESQGYHTSAGAGQSYSSSLNVALNSSISLTSGDSLISTTPKSYSTPSQTYVEEAAVLTVVATTPPSGSFRPGYCDTSGTLYNTSNLNYNLLSKLTVPSSAPSLATVADMFARPWIDHAGGWMGRQVHPNNNMRDYGKEVSADIGIGVLMLNLDYTDAEKEDILIGYVQLGIDLYSITESGGGWSADGGHASGRKFPIIFAGLLLGNSNMTGVSDVSFGEDQQTFYVSQTEIDITNSGIWGVHPNPDTRSGTPAPYNSSMIGMAEWGLRHSVYPVKDNSSWLAQYRLTDTAVSWTGWVLAAYIMDAKDLWNHDALFDYQDRYMAIAGGDPDPMGYTVSEETGGSRSFDTFSTEMWDTYRDDYDGTSNSLAIIITSPTTDTTYQTLGSTVDLSGTASDDGTVTGVAWECPTCTPTSGTATGTTAWSISGIGLSTGSNIIDVTATDNDSLTRSDRITVISGSVGTFAFSATDYSANMGDGYAYVTINRTGGSDGDVTVSWGTLSNTAINGTDYYGGLWDTVILDGATSATVSVQLYATGATTDKDFDVEIVSVDSSATIGTQSRSTITIIGDGAQTEYGTITAYSLLDGSVIPYKLTTE